MIKVLLADDHQLMIEGMETILQQEKEIEIVGKAATGDEVLNILKEKEVDVVVLDIEMPGSMGNGIDNTQIIRKDFPKTKVLILSMYNKKSFILKLMEAGAAGYILKNKSKEELLNAIYNVHRGNSHYGLEVLNQITQIGATDEEPEVQLSEREIEVLCKIAEGMTSLEISKLLNISPATVNTHRRNLLNKLDVPNDKHLVRYAIKHKLIEL